MGVPLVGPNRTEQRWTVNRGVVAIGGREARPNQNPESQTKHCSNEGFTDLLRRYSEVSETTKPSKPSKRFFSKPSNDTYATCLPASRSRSCFSASGRRSHRLRRRASRLLHVEDERREIRATNLDFA